MQPQMVLKPLDVDAVKVIHLSCSTALIQERSTAEISTMSDIAAVRRQEAVSSQQPASGKRYDDAPSFPACRRQTLECK